MFELPYEFSSSGSGGSINYPKYKRKKTRKRCYDILLELCKESEENKGSLMDILVDYCKDIKGK